MKNTLCFLVCFIPLHCTGGSSDVQSQTKDLSSANGNTSGTPSANDGSNLTCSQNNGTITCAANGVNFAQTVCTQETPDFTNAVNVLFTMVQTMCSLQNSNATNGSAGSSLCLINQTNSSTTSGNFSVNLVLQNGSIAPSVSLNQQSTNSTTAVYYSASALANPNGPINNYVQNLLANAFSVVCSNQRVDAIQSIINTIAPPPAPTTPQITGLSAFSIPNTSANGLGTAPINSQCVTLAQLKNTPQVQSLIKDAQLSCLQNNLSATSASFACSDLAQCLDAVMVCNHNYSVTSLTLSANVSDNGNVTGGNLKGTVALGNGNVNASISATPDNGGGATVAFNIGANPSATPSSSAQQTCTWPTDEWFVYAAMNKLLTDNNWQMCDLSVPTPPAAGYSMQYNLPNCSTQPTAPQPIPTSQ